MTEKGMGNLAVGTRAGVREETVRPDRVHILSPLETFDRNSMRNNVVG